MSYCLDVETFIGEVKKYPVIWDVNCDDHRYISKKQLAWAEVAKVFIPEVDEMPDGEKVDVYRKLHGKWRNIKDSFVRHLREKKLGKKSYIHAAQLSFLNNLYRIEKESDEDLDNTESWPSDEEPRKSKKRNFELIPEANIWGCSDDDTGLGSIKGKKVKKNEIEYVETFPENSCNYQVEDEDRSFFDSLLPAVRAFSLDQKLEFRSEILGVIKRIRSTEPRYKLDPESGDFDP